MHHHRLWEEEEERKKEEETREEITSEREMGAWEGERACLRGVQFTFGGKRILCVSTAILFYVPKNIHYRYNINVEVNKY